MCGIAGVIYRDANRLPDRAVLCDGAAIAHRGPDGEGILCEPGIGLVHRRLAIIDLVSGDQPIGNEDHSIQVVLNGEIYNYRQLRERVQSRGHRLTTKSDTETLVHLYEDDQENLVERLRGMFAFALWDGNRRQLLLVRDRVGIKPLYVYRDAEKLVFASELKGILAHPDIPRDLDEPALADYLAYGFVPGPRSIFRNIEKLQPGHTWCVSAANWNSSPRRYWQLQFDVDESQRDHEWEDAVRHKVMEAVQLHMIADVPVGGFLSGGIDSAVVVGCAARTTTTPLQTFSIGLDNEADSELPAARTAAAHFGTTHTDEIVTSDAASLLDELTTYFDEPFADSSALPTFLLARTARKHVKVSLSGDGGDEAFGGYHRYVHDLREAGIRRRVPAFVRRALQPIARQWPKADWLPRPLRLKTFLTNLSLNSGHAYANTLQLCRKAERMQLLSANVVSQLNGHNPESVVNSAYEQASSTDALAGMISADTATLLPDDYLVKMDRASMAHGLEVRPPFLDHELLELTARMPSRLKIHRGETKWMLKKAFHEMLPADAVRRPKRGFESPVDSWLRQPLREMFERTVLNRRSRIADLIDQSTAQSLYRSHVSGSGRHGPTLWALLVLAQWSDRYLPCFS